MIYSSNCPECGDGIRVVEEYKIRAGTDLNPYWQTIREWLCDTCGWEGEERGDLD